MKSLKNLANRLFEQTIYPISGALALFSLTSMAFPHSRMRESVESIGQSGGEALANLKQSFAELGKPKTKIQGMSPEELERLTPEQIMAIPFEDNIAWSMARQAEYEETQRLMAGWRSDEDEPMPDLQEALQVPSPPKARSVETTNDKTAREAPPRKARVSEGSAHKPRASAGSLSYASEPEFKKFTDHVKLREGFSAKVYKDRGVISVGWGHQVRPEDNLKLGDVISKERALGFLVADTKNAYLAAKDQMAQIGVNNSRLLVALASVNFQLGNAWHKEHVQTWTHLMNHNFAAAALEVKDSLWYKQTPTRVNDVVLALEHMKGKGWMMVKPRP